MKHSSMVLCAFLIPEDVCSVIIWQDVMPTREPVDVYKRQEVEINGEQWYIGHSMEYIKTAVKKQDNYSVNDIITVKAEEDVYKRQDICNTDH